MNLTDLELRVALQGINNQIVSKTLLLTPFSLKPLPDKEKMAIKSEIFELREKEVWIYKSLFKFTDVSREKAAVFNKSTSYVLQNRSFLSFMGNFNFPKLINISLIFLGMKHIGDFLKSYLR